MIGMSAIFARPCIVMAIKQKAAKPLTYSDFISKLDFREFIKTYTLAIQLDYETNQIPESMLCLSGVL